MGKSKDRFDELVDDITDPIVILGMTFSASRVLKELDPIAYRCHLADYKDSVR